MSSQLNVPFVVMPYHPKFDFFNDVYWTAPELANLNTACYHATVAYPSNLMLYFIEQYVDLVREHPNIISTPPNVQFHLHFILHCIDYYVCLQAHANALRRFVLVHCIGCLDPRILTDNYKEHLCNAPVPDWPWPVFPHPII